MLRRKEPGSTRSARWVFPRTAIHLSVSWFLLLLLSAAPVAGQRGRTDGPPHYPTATERLPATLPHAGVRVVKLAGTVFNDDPALGRPGHLFIQEGFLWVTDLAGDPYLHLIELPSGRLLSSRGRDGEGPGDFRNVMQLSVRPGDTDAIWAYDYSQRRLTRVERRPIAGIPPVTITGAWQRVDSSLPTWNVLRMFWLDEQRIAAIGHCQHRFEMSHFHRVKCHTLWDHC